MGEPAIFTPEQLAEIHERAQLIRDAVADDEANPVIAPFLERIKVIIEGSRDVDDILATMREGVTALVAELDTLALALTQESPDAIRERGQLASVRREPAAGEVLPPEQRASWARGETEHDRPVSRVPGVEKSPLGGRFVPHPNCPSPSGRKA